MSETPTKNKITLLGKYDLDDIPGSLRRLATNIDLGLEPNVDCAIIILPHYDHRPPRILAFGTDEECDAKRIIGELALAQYKQCGLISDGADEE